MSALSAETLVTWTDITGNQQFGSIVVVLSSSYGVANIDHSFWVVPFEDASPWDGQ